MTDIIERAEAALEGVTEGDWAVRDGFVYPLSIRCGLGGIWERDARFIAAARTLVPELIDTLKDTRAQLDAWKETADHYKWSADEVGQLKTALKAARADNERLRGDLFSRLRAFGRDCVQHGDMTPNARRMLDSIADLYEPTS